MLIYVVLGHNQYANTDILSIFSTSEDAEYFRNSTSMSRKYDEYTVEEHRILQYYKKVTQ